MNDDKSQRLLSKCPYCGLYVEPMDFEKHFNQVHIVDSGAGKASNSMKSQTIDNRVYTIDEGGFILPENIQDPSKVEKDLNQPYSTFIPHRKVEQTHTYKDIKEKPATNKVNRKFLHKSHDARRYFIRPRSFEIVYCPICQEKYTYDHLFSHVSTIHKALEPKLVLSAFNREFDRLAREYQNIRDIKTKLDKSDPLGISSEIYLPIDKYIRRSEYSSQLTNSAHGHNLNNSKLDQSKITASNLTTTIELDSQYLIKIDKVSIDELDLPPRIMNIFLKHNVYTIGDVYHLLKVGEIASWAKVGDKSISMIINAITSYSQR